MTSQIERVAVYCYDIENSIEIINTFLSGKTKDDFKNDIMMQDAVNMRLIVIGESVNHIQKNFSELIKRHDEIPWHLIRGMRNKIAHDYFNIDPSQVWETAKNDIQELKKFINQIKESEPELAETIAEIKSVKNLKKTADKQPEKSQQHRSKMR